ncbi:MAG: ATP-binding protein, partial [Myxococcales bacterium]|nr:ATP-binding protein [Myxococcales bacterium]
RNRISGPLLDRIDLQVSVDPVDPRSLRGAPTGEDSAAVRDRVQRARRRQTERLGAIGLACNAQLRPAHLAAFCALDEAAGSLLGAAIDRLGLSARAHDRVLKVARTIADLEGAPSIGATHMAEAIQYRQLDREGGA